MSGDKVFIDTNIFVYAKSESEQNTEKHFQSIRFLENIDAITVISTQIISEFISAMLKYRIEDDRIFHAITAMIQECIVSPVSLKTVESAWHIRQTYRYSYWDSMVISSAMENRCSVLYTEDLQHNQMIENRLRVINPLL